jgi:Domain of unknown function DUF29
MATARERIPRPASYDEDGYSWALEQAALLRAGRLDAIDAENVAEEIESLGKSFANELRSRYGALVMHLLKWQCQPAQRSNSWIGTIRRERIVIAKHLRDNPGLKHRRQELLDDSYDEAVQGAVAETNLPVTAFPAECPYTLDETMDPDFWPGGAQLPDRPAHRRR